MKNIIIAGASRVGKSTLAGKIKSQEQVGFMSVQGGLDTLYKFVKNNGWDKITEPAVQSWGTKACFVTTIDGSILQFQEVK